MTNRISLITFLILMLLIDCAYAKEIDLQKEYTMYDKPTASFDILKDGIKIGEANSNYYDSSIYTFDQSPNTIHLHKDDVITICDNSRPGSGNKLVKWDLQIYSPKGNELYVLNEKSNVNKSVKLDREGRWDIYLCVQDSAELSEGFENLSVNGNHRWLGKSKELDNTYIWWCFSQIQIIVENKNETSDDQKEDNKNNEEDIIPIEEKKNSAPITEIITPEILYSVDFTRSKKYANTISWDYYDEDNDRIIDAGYKLYKIKGNEKTLIEEGKNKIKQRERKVNIEGEMLDTFYLEVWVCDEKGQMGYDERELLINMITPKLKLECEDRTYLDEIINVHIVDDESELNAFLNYEYDEWIIIDDTGKVVMNDKGKINYKILIDSRKFKENEFYTIEQKIKFKGKTIAIQNKLFVVEVLKPTINIKNISSYYGREHDIEMNLIQDQSKLKGNLNDYILKIIPEKTWYEIYDENGIMKYKNDGIIKNISLDEKSGIKNINERQVYKIVQYITNSKDKMGIGMGLIEVKPKEETKVEIKILERDENLKTEKTKIYTDESLLVDTQIYEGYYQIKKEWYEIKNEDNRLIMSFDGRANGLIKISSAVGKYRIIQYVEDINNNKFSASANFEIIPIQKPVIIIEPVKDDNYYYGNEIKLVIEIYDINKSEEHPNGFNIYSSYELNDRVYEGKFKSLAVNNFEKKNAQKIIQHAINIEHKEIENVCEYEFNVLNSIPKLFIDMQKEIFVGEIAVIKINAIDDDGIVEKLNYEIKDKALEILEERIIKEKGNIYIELKVKANEEKKVSIEADCIDNDGDLQYMKKNINLTYSELPIDIYIENEKEMELKTDRYIKWICKSEDADRIDIQYSDTNEMKYKDVLESTLYEDEKVKIYFDCIDNSYVEFSMYFKKVGKYSFKARGMSEEKNGKWKQKEVAIVEDDIPDILLTTDKFIYRDRMTKRATIKGNIVLDAVLEDIDEESIKINIYKNSLSTVPKVISTNDKNFEYKLSENELGTYYLIGSVKKLAKQLPSTNHPLYEELCSKVKSSTSLPYMVQVININPSLSYQIFKSNVRVVRYNE